MTRRKFELTEKYSVQETQLLNDENQLRVLAKSDTGLSQKVITLRKQV